jgi:hypothetical protein
MIRWGVVATFLLGSALLGAVPARADLSLEEYDEIKQGRAQLVTGDEALFYLAGALDGVRTADLAVRQSGQALFCLPEDLDLGLGALDDLIAAHMQEIRETRPDAQDYFQTVSVGTALLLILNRDYPCNLGEDGEMPDIIGRRREPGPAVPDAGDGEPPQPPVGGRTAQ